jgi:two-component system, NarL family, sensor histidine kinase UhpB
MSHEVADSTRLRAPALKGRERAAPLARGLRLHRLASRRRGSLAWRVFAINAAILSAACIGLIATPVTVSNPVSPTEVAILVAGVVLMLLVNLFVVRRTFAPLERLAELMPRVDPLRPGTRLELDASTEDVAAIAAGFNEMLERLEGERRESARRALRAQESERLRIGRELHDELGQALTGILLELDQFARSYPGDGRLAESREAARASLEHIRRIARDLRPDALDQLGLGAAVIALATRLERQTGITVDRRIGALPVLSHDAEVVIYRVAQESLANAARHAAPRRIELRLGHDADDLVLTVEDDGLGWPLPAREGSGVRGMRERALLVHGKLALGPGAAGGTRVTLRVPLEDAAG